jgi:hypothetical protein
VNVVSFFDKNFKWYEYIRILESLC